MNFTLDLRDNYINQKIKRLEIDFKVPIFAGISIKNKFLKRLTNI